MSLLDLHIQAITADDIDRVRALAQALPEAPHWPRAVWEAILDPASTPRRIALLALEAQSGALAGFAVASLMPPEAELEAIAVTKEFQRKGVAGTLFRAVKARLWDAGVVVVLLEVRPSNLAAQGLYHRLGFAETGRRPGYYTDPREDALVLRLKMC